MLGFEMPCVHDVVPLLDADSAAEALTERLQSTGSDSLYCPRAAPTQGVVPRVSQEPCLRDELHTRIQRHVQSVQRHIQSGRTVPMYHQIEVTCMVMLMCL